MDEITRRLDKFRRNKNELSPYNTSAQNSAIIAQQNNQKFLDKSTKEKEKLKIYQKELLKIEDRVLTFNCHR